MCDASEPLEQPVTRDFPIGGALDVFLLLVLGLVVGPGVDLVAPTAPPRELQTEEVVLPLSNFGGTKPADFDDTCSRPAGVPAMPRL